MTPAPATTPSMTPLTDEQAARQLRRAGAVAGRAMAMGRHPFGALLLAPDGETVLAEQGNIDTVNHAESTLARTAAAAALTPPGWPARSRALSMTWVKPARRMASSLASSEPFRVMVSMP